MITLMVDGKEIEVEEGKSLLEGCLKEGIYIPHLCFMEEMDNPPASCRLCLVEIEGVKKPVASCKIAPKEGMVVRTDTEAVRRLQRTALRLLLTVHDAKCRHCPSNRKCPLQDMTRFLGVRLKPRRYDHLDRVITAPLDHPLFEFVPSRCILCGKCIYVCEKQSGYSLLTFAKRGFDTVITSFGVADAAKISCGACLKCVQICPVSAILVKTGESVNG